MSREVLSDAQFADRVNNGGATRRMSDHEVPTSGYMVSTPTRGFAGSQGSYQPTGELTAHGAHAHQKYLEAAHGGMLSTDDTGPHVADGSAYQGGWHDKATGITHLDRSIKVYHPGLAVALGQSNKQVAIWDNKSEHEIRVAGLNPRGYGPRPKK